MRKKLLTSLLALCLTLSLTAVPAAALELEDARELLRNYYVDEIPESVLELDSLEEILEALGDPYTSYMSAEEYQAFLSSVNGESVTGVGISIRTIFDNGYQILSILPDSPALEAGLEAGDRIIAVDGQTLTSETDVQGLVSGKAGTTVTLTVIRQADGLQKDYTMIRRSVVIPIVTYDLADNAGFISCTSFGESTSDTIQEALETLNDTVSVWIIDLGSNPGGTSEAASASAGLFVGGNVIMVYFRDANDSYRYQFTPPFYPDLSDKPLIVLTSPYSASAAELFAAAARDHGFGIAIGQRTFGKGVAQYIFNENNTTGLFDGDCLKITVYRFYSPSGTTNHTVGIIPSLVISSQNDDTAALLLSASQPSRASGYLKLQLAGQTFYLDLKRAQQQDNAAAFTELLEALPPSAVLSKGTASQTWTEIEPSALAADLGLSYTARSFSDIAGSPFEREIRTLAAYQLLSGYSDGTFRPENTITRAEFCAMIASAFNLPSNEKALTFSDTSADAWYADAVSAMASYGFISGYSDGTFRPNSTITYEEMVTILAAVAAWSNMDGYDLAQAEIPAGEWLNYSAFSAWAQSPAYTLDSLGALVGDQVPTDSGTRETAAGLLCTLMESIHLLWD